jgi:tetratricopeptide (TPR) repeat protein
MKRLIGKSIIILAMIAVSLSPGKSDAQRVVPRDYFNPKYKHELATVEKYHLTKETFWKEFESRRYYYALLELKFVLRWFPNHPRALQLMELVAKMMNQAYLVIPYYEEAVRLYPQHALTHAQFGNYLVDTGQAEKGIERLQRALQIDPKLAVAYYWLWDAYTKIGNPEMSRQIAEKAKELGLNVQERPR